MRRWIALPLVALLALVMSGFLSNLEKTTEASARLARASEEAPQTTGEAARQVEALPQLAELTSRQATAFKALADALEVSAERIEDFNRVVEDQGEGLQALSDTMATVRSPLGCVEERLADLLEASSATPDSLVSLSETMDRITRSQNKAIRHLKSINRKLTALGLVGRATGVKKPPPPPDAPALSPDFEAGPLPC